MKLHIFKKCRECDLQITITLFLCVLLVYIASGGPFFALDRQEQIEKEEAQRRAEDEARDRKLAEAKREEDEKALKEFLNQPPSFGHIKGPGSRYPLNQRADPAGPKSAYDYLPEAQRRMLEPGRNPASGRGR